MKKLWLALLLVCVPLKVRAYVAEPEVLQEKTVIVHFSTTVPAAATANFDLVSLNTSSSTLWPHLDRGEIDISHVNVMIDKVATSTGTVKLGVCTFVNSSTGTVVFFYTSSFQKNVSNGNLPFPNNFSPAYYRCKVNSGRTATNSDVDGTLPFILSNDRNQGSSAYRSTATLSLQLNSPVGLVQPGIGDIIMEVRNLDPTNSVIIFIEVWYHSEP